MGASVFWNRLDVPGSDACILGRVASGWRLEGHAVFLDTVPCAVAYSVDTDAHWITADARLHGFVGDVGVSVAISRAPAGWSIDGAPVQGTEDCLDVDLGFTPATNIIPLRRLELAVGSSHAVASAWFDLAAMSLCRLDQTYERIGERHYRYRAPAFGYDAVLEVDRDGFVQDHPGLWRMPAV